ncbi:MAG: hypothetical protein IID43_03975 [Planctomycetes bacterium]|nr:hypothetical protein [Planctomycetota bacterium]
MGVDLAAAVNDQLEIRRRVGALWREVFDGGPHLYIPQERSGAEPAYLRVPVLAASKEIREVVVARLAKVGFRFVRSFPSTLAGVHRFDRYCTARPSPGAEQLAARVIALPCHIRVGQREIRRAQLALSGILTPEPNGRIALNAVAGMGG